MHLLLMTNKTEHKQRQMLPLEEESGFPMQQCKKPPTEQSELSVASELS